MNTVAWRKLLVKERSLEDGVVPNGFIGALWRKSLTAIEVMDGLRSINEIRIVVIHESLFSNPSYMSKLAA